MNLSKSNYQIHFCFIFLIAIHYLISIIFVGQIIVEPHDNLDITVVGDHVISKIYKGDFGSISYFLSGEIKWYYFEKLFYPTNLLHYMLDDKLFYFTNDILKKLIPYFSFYLLAKYLKISRFSSALGAVLYSTILYIDSPLGLGMAFLPYILYLLLKKNSLDKKHYFVLFLIGLNSALVHDFFSFIFLIPLTFILKNQNKNLKIYIQVFSVIFIACILSNIHVIVGTVFGETIQRVEWNLKDASILTSFLGGLKYLFHINFAQPLFIFHIPLALLSLTLFVLSFLSKQKNIKLIFIFIIFILILKMIMNYNVVDNFFIGVLEMLKGYNFSRVLSRIAPLLLAILFILLITNLKNKKLKNFLFFLSILSIISVQLKTPAPVIGQYLLKKNMSTDKFEEVKKVFIEKNYVNFIKIVFDQNNYAQNNMSFKNSTNRTFDNYYMFKDYAYIKNIVKDSRVMSVGLDPMVAVMNDIKVIDGYHTIYPLSYKIKFRKVIEKELEKNIKFQNYYDLWGSRVYAFHNDKNNILLNFQAAKKLKAEYIISKFPIKSNELETVCAECNNTNYMFLYKIL